MNAQLANELYEKGLLQPISFEKIKENNLNPQLFSLHWEIKTLLYLGVLLLSGGLAILVYKNIDTIPFILYFSWLTEKGCYSITGWSFISCRHGFYHP